MTSSETREHAVRTLQIPDVHIGLPKLSHYSQCTTHCSRTWLLELSNEHPRARIALLIMSLLKMTQGVLAAIHTQLQGAPCTALLATVHSDDDARMDGFGPHHTAVAIVHSPQGHTIHK